MTTELFVGLLSATLLLTLWYVLNRKRELVRLKCMVDDRYEITRVVTEILSCGVLILSDDLIVKKINNSYILSDIFFHLPTMFTEGHCCRKSLEYIPELKTLIETALRERRKETSILSIEDDKRIIVVDVVPIELHFKEHGTLLLKIEDITNNVRLSNELREAHKKIQLSDYIYSQILENIPDFIVIKSIKDEFKYIKVSEAFCHFLKKTEDEIIGKTDFELYPAELAEKYYIYDKKAIQENGHEVYETSFEDETKLCWRIARSVFTTNDGQQLLVVVASNMTDINNTTEELKKAKHNAEEADRLKSKFLANMSHEIRTPLNAIVGFSELIQYAKNDNEREEYFKLINLNNDVLLRLIDDILNLSRLESGIVTLQRELYDLREILENVYANFKKHMDNSPVELRLNISLKHSMVYLDRNRLNQILTNYMTNAKKFTQKGHIEIGCREEDGGINVYVKDTGVGIPKNKQNNIFNQFEKLDEFSQGSGLGLSICKAIADVSGNKIGVNSEVGVGSTFWIWIKPAIKQVKYEKEQSLPCCYPDSDEIIDTAHSLKHEEKPILVVEDCDSNYRLIQVLLKSYTIERAKHGEEAIAMAKAKNYSIILMDLKLPVMDGLQATQKIRCFNKQVPIIAVTGNAYESDRISAIEAGCTHFVTKPLRKEPFTTMIKEIYN